MKIFFDHTNMLVSSFFLCFYTNPCAVDKDSILRAVKNVKFVFLLLYYIRLHTLNHKLVELNKMKNTLMTGLSMIDIDSSWLRFEGHLILINTLIDLKRKMIFFLIIFHSIIHHEINIHIQNSHFMTWDSKHKVFFLT